MHNASFIDCFILFRQKGHTDFSAWHHVDVLVDVEVLMTLHILVNLQHIEGVDDNEVIFGGFAKCRTGKRWNEGKRAID